MTDPNVKTTDSGEQVILEPGDPGYVDPAQTTTEGQTESARRTRGGRTRSSEANPPLSTSGEVIDTSPETAPGPDEPLGAPAPLGEDLQHVQQPGEDYATFLARTRNVAVVSQNPTDIVPNTPQITMGQRVPVEGVEGLVQTQPGDPEEIDSDALAREREEREARGETPVEEEEEEEEEEAETAEAPE